MWWSCVPSAPCNTHWRGRRHGAPRRARARVGAARPLPRCSRAGRRGARCHAVGRASCAACRGAWMLLRGAARPGAHLSGCRSLPAPAMPGGCWGPGSWRAGRQPPPASCGMPARARAWASGRPARHRAACNAPPRPPALLTSSLSPRLKAALPTNLQGRAAIMQPARQEVRRQACRPRRHHLMGLHRCCSCPCQPATRDSHVRLQARSVLREHGLAVRNRLRELLRLQAGSGLLELRARVRHAAAAAYICSKPN